MSPPRPRNTEVAGSVELTINHSGAADLALVGVVCHFCVAIELMPVH